jgi:hypothetical protein
MQAIQLLESPYQTDILLDNMVRSWASPQYESKGQVDYNLGKLKGEKRRHITEKEWLKLLSLLNQASFWQLPSKDRAWEPNERGEVAICLDNTDWYLEGVKGSKYHVVDRYCPESQSFKAIGLYMVDLSKLGIKESDLH